MLLPGSVRPTAEAGKAQVETRAPAAPLDAGAVCFEEYILPAAGDVDITQQEILVAVGRGIQQKDNLELAEELAAALGGAVCASRPVIDQGWLPATRQVGKSGMTVKPRCFIALGISGAPEHVEGMKDSDLIFAVNTDPNAPIFDVAHYGVVGDLWTLSPRWWKRSRRNRRIMQCPTEARIPWRLRRRVAGDPAGGGVGRLCAADAPPAPRAGHGAEGKPPQPPAAAGGGPSSRK